LLQRAGCELPRGLSVEVEILEAPEPSLNVHYDVQASVAKPAAVPARLHVTKGKTTDASYLLINTRTNIGRMPVVLDRDQRPLRSNDIAFEEGADEVNATVSRSH